MIVMKPFHLKWQVDVKSKLIIGQSKSNGIYYQSLKAIETDHFNSELSGYVGREQQPCVCVAHILFARLDMRHMEYRPKGLVRSPLRECERATLGTKRTTKDSGDE
jgi:hypothetical protein